jgi:hypothetical protein
MLINLAALWMASSFAFAQEVAPASETTAAPAYARARLGFRTQYPLIRDVPPAVGVDEFQSLPPFFGINIRYEPDLARDMRNFDGWVRGSIAWTLLTPAPLVHATGGLALRHGFFAASIGPELSIQDWAFPGNPESVYSQNFLGGWLRGVFHLPEDAWIALGLRYNMPFTWFSSFSAIAEIEGIRTYLKTRSLWTPSLMAGFVLPGQIRVRMGMDVLIPEPATLASDQFKIDLGTDIALFRPKWSIGRDFGRLGVTVSGSHLVAPIDATELPYRMPQMDEEFALSSFLLALEVSWIF